MKNFLRRAAALCLSLSLLSSLAVTAAASEALGEDLKEQAVQLNKDTELSTNVFWSSAYSDLRTENFITYEPNRTVKPLVMFGDALTDRTTVSAAARKLEQEGKKRMKQIGNVEVPQKAFLAVLKLD